MADVQLEGLPQPPMVNEWLTKKRFMKLLRRELRGWTVDCFDGEQEGIWILSCEKTGKWSGMCVYSYAMRVMTKDALAEFAAHIGDQLRHDWYLQKRVDNPFERSMKRGWNEASTQIAQLMTFLPKSWAMRHHDLVKERERAYPWMGKLDCAWDVSSYEKAREIARVIFEAAAQLMHEASAFLPEHAMALEKEEVKPCDGK